MEGKTISSLPDFAEIFLFLQNLGPYMKLPGISLADLENFFRIVDFYNSETDQVAHIQKRLLRYAGAKQGANEWPHMAVKFGRKMGLLSEVIPYQDVSLKVRMKIFRCACEEQFDCNVNLRNVLKRDTPGMLSRPVGVDRNGVRYWLLQDSTFDMRLYGEGNYDEPPPVLPTWTLLAWSLDELADHISLLESRHPADSAAVLSPASPPSVAKATQCEGGRRRGTPCVEGDEEEEEEEGGPSDGSRMREKASGSLRKRPATKRPNQRSAPKKSKKKAAAEVVEVSDESDVVGCLKCRKDSDHKKMLLCDTCDRECHTYCQYPVLWSIPRGKWLCPVCKEEQLLKKLREFYLHLSQSKLRQEQQVARKERSVARLQKSGVLLQNIILEENEGRRARRNRKEVNYAELNDVYLPPLGPRDFVGQDAAPMAPVRTRRNKEYYIQEDYLAPRVRNNSRRYRGDSPTLAPLKEAEEEEEEEGGRREDEKEDSLSSDGDSGQGIDGRNSVEGSGGDGLVMRLSVLHSSRLRDQRSSSCGEEEEEEEDVEVGVVSDRESDSLKHRTPNESGGEEEEEEEEVEVDDSRGKGSLTVDSKPASSSLDSKGHGSAQPSGRGSLQPRGHGHNETGSMGEGRGTVGYSSWDAGRYLPGSDVFHRPGALGSSPNWGVPNPYLMRGMAPIQSHTHYMAPIQNSHLIGGMAPRHQGPVGASPTPHHHHHLIKGVAPNLGPPPPTTTAAATHPFWGMAPTQNPSPHLLHGNALPVVGSSNTSGSSKNSNIPDPHQHLNLGRKYMF